MSTDKFFEQVYDALCFRLSEFFGFGKPVSIKWLAPWEYVFGEYNICPRANFVPYETQDQGSQINAKLMGTFVLQLKTPEHDGTDGFMVFADALNKHFFVNDEPTAYALDDDGTLYQTVYIVREPSLLTELTYEGGLILGDLGVHFQAQPNRA